jgi:hypothetical protein
VAATNLYEVKQARNPTVVKLLTTVQYAKGGGGVGSLLLCQPVKG